VQADERETASARCEAHVYPVVDVREKKGKALALHVTLKLDDADHTLRERLPQRQYSYREVRTGLMFLGYSDVLSLQHATVFAQWVMAWMEEHGLKSPGDRWQTDGGSEFIGSWCAKRKSAFIKAVESRGIRHFQIPKTTYNADVETVHNLIELEFFDIERFKDRRV
jgi:hypothetical protein